MYMRQKAALCKRPLTDRRASKTQLSLYTRTFVALPASVVARKQEDWVKASCHH